MKTVSPMPLVLSMSGPSEGMETTGTMVRVMMFQSLPTEIGITGWMLRTFCVPFSGPKLRFVLFWNGTLIRLPTGFCASFASSSALSSARAGAAADQHRRAEGGSEPNCFGLRVHASLHDGRYLVALNSGPAQTLRLIPSS